MLHGRLVGQDAEVRGLEAPLVARLLLRLEAQLTVDRNYSIARLAGQEAE